MSSVLCAFGHVATTGELAAAGLTRRARDMLPAQGAYRPRRGTYACAHLQPYERAAVSCRARLDCITVLKAEGIWTGFHTGLHLRFRCGDKQARAHVAVIRTPTSMHWGAERFGGGDRIRVSVQEAVFCALRCLPAEDAIAAIESAVHLGRLTRGQALAVIDAAPRSLKPVMDFVDPTFRAQSGYETKVRLRLEARGHRVAPQFALSERLHLDNLVDGVVAVETDGKQHAETLAEDHRRDLATEGAGIRALRIDPMLVDTRWEQVLAVIERMIREAGRP
jgi:very-short-patch-repair endonuclease